MEKKGKMDWVGSFLEISSLIMFNVVWTYVFNDYGMMLLSTLLQSPDGLHRSKLPSSSFQLFSEFALFFSRRDDICDSSTKRLDPCRINQMQDNRSRCACLGSTTLRTIRRAGNCNLRGEDFPFGGF